MQFLLPSALWIGLFLLPIILLLHLLRNRRQQMPISSLALWHGLQKRRRGSRFRNIPLTLMLFLQLFIATMLILSLARPVSSYILGQPQHTIFILDMTNSMLATNGSSSRFDVARQKIQATIDLLGPKDSISVIGLKSRPEVLFSSDDELRATTWLNNLKAGAIDLDLPAALALATTLLDSARDNKIVVLTDGNYMTTLPLLSPVTHLEWQIIAGQPLISNQALLNVSTKRLPNNQHQLFARVVNYSDVSVERTVQVSIGQREFDQITVKLSANGEVSRVWTLPAGVETAKVEILETDALLADNVAELWLQSVTRHKLLLRSETPEILTRVLKAHPTVELTIDTFDDPTYDPADFALTVLENVRLDDTLPPGNLLVVNPIPHQSISNLRPDSSNVATWLADIDWSGVYFGRVFSDTLPGWGEIDLVARPKNQPLIDIDTDETATPIPLIFHGSVNDREILVWAFDFDDSNLPARLAFPLLLDAGLSMLLSPLPPDVVMSGEPVYINSNNFTIVFPDSRRLANSQERNFTDTQQPGIYRIYQDENSPPAGFAVHAGSAFESNLMINDLRPVVDELQLTTDEVKTDYQSEPLYYEFWPWLASLALGVVVIEGWLAWRGSSH